MSSGIPPALVEGVRMLCLDAGNTVIFLDHARLAKLANEAGESVSAARLIVAEGEMKLALETGDMVDAEWKERSAPGAAGWGRALATMLVRSGVPRANVGPLLEMIWPHHKRLNLWSIVPAGFGDAMSKLRSRDVKVVLVSNSEGMLAELFDELGILASFDLLLDSGKLGVEKPDPRIFRIGLEKYAVHPHEALHLGDTFATDIVGARAAGVRAALIDPHAHYRDVHVDVPRVPGVVEVAHAIAEAW
jgi:putative hydrolase of the HAD superfamily